MPIVQITRTGLVTIALLVDCLWTCIVVEHRILSQAQARQSEELNNIRHMRDRQFAVPASYPKSGVTSPHSLTS